MDNTLDVVIASFDFEILYRLLLAVGAGALVGIEREFHGRPAGLRTHILVSLGAAVVALISTVLPRMSDVLGSEATLRIDPGRIAAGVVTGIGFLGAGAIIRIGITARGLTTAASLWCMAGVGMGFGLGLYQLSMIATVLMLFTLFVLGSFEKKISRRWYKSVKVGMKGPDQNISELISRFKKQGWRIIDIKLEKDKRQGRMNVEYNMRLNDKKDVAKLTRTLEAVEFVEDYSVS